MNEKIIYSKRLLAINSASSILAQLVNMTVLFWAYRYLLQNIGDEEYSLLPVIGSFMMFPPLLSMILVGGFSRFITEAYAEDNEYKVTQIVSTMLPVLLAWSLLFAAAGALICWQINWIINIPDGRLWDARLMVGLLFASITIRMPVSLFGTGMGVKQRFVLSNLIGVCGQLVKISLLFYLLYFVSVRVIWVVISSVSTELLLLFINVTISRHLLPCLRFRRAAIDWSLLKGILSFGGWNFVGSVAETIRSNVDILILNRFSTAQQVTSFHMGAIPQRYISQLALASLRSSDPVLISFFANKKVDQIRRVFLRGGRLGLWFSMFTALPLMIFSSQVIYHYIGDGYAAAALVMTMLLSTYPVAYGNIIAAKLAHASGNIRPWQLRTISMHGVNLGLTYIFVAEMEMGAVGSALATLLCNVLIYPPLFFPLGMRLADVRLGPFMRETLLPGYLPSIAAGLFWVAARLLLNLEGLVELGTVVAAGWVVYAVAVFALLKPEDKADIRKIRQKLGLS